MYFDAKTIVQILGDDAAAQAAAPAIAALRRRFTSPMAVAEAILILGPDFAADAGTDAGADASAGATDRTGADHPVLAYLDGAGIEIRDMPPSHRLIEAASLPETAGLDLAEVMNRACATYYEAEPFSLTAPPAAPADPAGA